jgi:DNA-damage-inducible protein J
MPIKNSIVSARIDPRIKKEAEAILAKQGLTPSLLINALYDQIISNKGIPFAMLLCPDDINQKVTSSKRMKEERI